MDNADFLFFKRDQRRSAQQPLSPVAKSRVTTYVFESAFYVPMWRVIACVSYACVRVQRRFLIPQKLNRNSCKLSTSCQVAYRRWTRCRNVRFTIADVQRTIYIVRFVRTDLVNIFSINQSVRLLRKLYRFCHYTSTWNFAFTKLGHFSCAYTNVSSCNWIGTEWEFGDTKCCLCYHKRNHLSEHSAVLKLDCNNNWL